jgi:hypothetical protein
MYALIPAIGIVNIMIAGFMLGAAIKPDLGDAGPIGIAGVVVVNLFAAIRAGQNLRGGKLVRIEGDILFYHLPPHSPDPDQE